MFAFASVDDARLPTWAEMCVLVSVLHTESTVKHKRIPVKGAIRQHYEMYLPLKSGTSGGGEGRVVAHRRGVRGNGADVERKKKVHWYSKRAYKGK